MTKKLITIFLTVLSLSSFGQDSNTLFSRLRGISNNGTDFYNIDGIEITSQNINSAFSKKTILKKFKKYKIKEDDLLTADSLIGKQNFYVAKSDELCIGVIQNTSYYFVENNNGLTAITFASENKKDKAFETEFVKLILSNGIPKYVYEPLEIDSINFAGRKIALGKACNWMGTNNVQCPYYGQMNWSIHKNLQDATQTMNNQYTVTKLKKSGKIVSEELVNVTFEGSEIKAKKIIYDIKGINSLLVGMSGGKTLTIYYVASPVRGNFVSCVMSFWNNDTINKSGLPSLLEEVMKLNK
jgi:hypothetical protein